MAHSFYWHDYETWGLNARRDRPCQFAGVRTDAELNIIDEPLVLFCRPTPDVLPQPAACLKTRFFPQYEWDAAHGEYACRVQSFAQQHPTALQCCEAEFAARIQQQFAQPDTCIVGFNNINFDDEVTRALFYRNFYDPYAHTHQFGNSRWDLINVLRLARALRPEGMEWPRHETGATSFQLEQLCQANGITVAGPAHDALVDTQSTLALARKLKQAQPRLFDYALTLRDKQTIQTLAAKSEPFLHVSGRYPAERGCIAPVLSLGEGIDRTNAALVFDLRTDPTLLADLSVDAIRQRLFTSTAELPADQSRIPLKNLRFNACSMVAPLATLTPAAADQWQIDVAQVRIHAQRLQQLLPTLRAKLQLVYQERPASDERDPEQLLYTGGFIPDADKPLLAQVRAASPDVLATTQFHFRDNRLPTLLLRYRARNWPDSLNDTEREEWDAWRFEQLTAPTATGDATIDAYLATLDQLRGQYAHDAEQQQILDALTAWAEYVMDAA